MKILMICGVYEKEYEGEVLQYTKGYAEQSANIFQRKLINGIKENEIEYKIISAPFIGAYPIRYKQLKFKGFDNRVGDIEYVSFNNIWGLRNISRARAMKRAIKAYFDCEDEENFLILIYCAHTPFLEAGVYAKQLRPKSKICFIVPDLPQYMNLDEKKRRIYDFFKKYDINKMNKYIDKVDSFVLLTEPMKEILNVGNRPYIVVEGLIDEIKDDTSAYEVKSDGIKRIVYTGKMNVKFGIKNLVDSFMKIKGENYRLILCGDGDARSYVEEQSKKDFRIEYKGVVTSLVAKEYINSADVLVNPRPNSEEYTKYSFPSKIIEYLMTGNPVVAYMLDGMPKCYESFIYIIPDECYSFEAVIHRALSFPISNIKFIEYANANLKPDCIVNKIIKQLR